MLLTAICHAQTDYAYQTFDDTRIVNGHSIETKTKGTLTFIISHRFGRVDDGAVGLWGLDNAFIRLGFDYGITDRLMAGLGRTKFGMYDGYLKYRLLHQSTGEKNIPLSLSLLGSSSITSNEGQSFSQKAGYTLQAIVARKFGDRLGAQIMPTYLYRGFVAANDNNNMLSLGLATQYQVFQNWSLTLEYYATPEQYQPEDITSKKYYRSLALGFQVDTKGHIFQFHVTNSQGMIARAFLPGTTDSWTDGGLHFGFNITRDFTIKGREIR